MTDRLADVIHIIQFGNKSGVLAVERANGSIKEEGYIRFVLGRIVEARVGQYNGLAAFNYLATWQTCLFALVTETPTTQLPAPMLNAPAMSSPVSYDTADNNGHYGDYQRDDAHLALPQRLQRGEESIRYPERIVLSRLHRRLLMLIDGRRGLDDLARLMVRSPNEVQDLLNDLVRGGFIRQ